MTTILSTEDYIRRSKIMDGTPALLSIPAQPLSPGEQATLREALNVTLGSKRDDLRRILDFNTWVEGPGRHYTQIEQTAEAYIRDLEQIIREISSVHVMMENAKKGRIVAKADA